MSLTSEAIVLSQPGGPGQLVLETVHVADPGPGQIRLRQSVAGVNFHDIYVRSGAYQTLRLPGIPGLEAVGVIEALGEGVSGFSIGQRVAYIDRFYGAYARARVVDAALAVAVPDGVEDAVAAAWFLKGLTAQVLVDAVHKVGAGDRVLVQAAGGGVGQVLSRMARLRGATVIGTAGSAEKIALAQAAGCHHVIPYREADVAAEVARLTDRAGVHVAYDAVGKDTFDGSLAALSSRGHLVNYGQASGPIPPLDIARLGAKSATLSRPFLFAYISTRPELEAQASAFFAAAPDLPLGIGGRFPLAQAGAAQAALENREPGPFVLDC